MCNLDDGLSVFSISLYVLAQSTGAVEYNDRTSAEG